MLVHCHAGKSRSVSLVLAWLMTRRRWPLNRALDFLRRMRPEAEPNAGYLAALLRLEEELFGRQTVKVGGCGGVCRGVPAWVRVQLGWRELERQVQGGDGRLVGAIVWGLPLACRALGGGAPLRAERPCPPADWVGLARVAPSSADEEDQARAARVPRVRREGGPQC